MPLDPNRWTLKTQEAFQAALDQARARNHPEVTPDHLLVALLGQEEGVVLPTKLSDSEREGVREIAERRKHDDVRAHLL